MKKILFLLLTLCSFSKMAYSDMTWSAPVAISTLLTDATDPHVVIDSSGNATAIWVENGAIKAGSLPFGGNWSTPATLSNVLNTSLSPKLSLDSSGNVTALWVENGQIESAVLPFGGSWGTETSPISGSGASNPTLAIDATGRAVAVWVRSGFIESSTRISGTWSQVSVLSTTTSSNPSVAISSFGTAIAAWHSVVSSADVIETNILTLSTNTWGTTKNVFNLTAAFSHNYPKIAIDANGNAIVAWFRYNFSSGVYDNVQVLTSSLTAGVTAWALPTILSNPGIRNPADLMIKPKFDANGNAVIVWKNSYDGATFNIESSQQLFGGSWQSYVSPQVPSLYSLGIDLAISSGTILLTAMSWDGVSSIIITSQESNSTNPLLQGWTTPNLISTNADNGYPQCAISLNGNTFNAITVWSYFNGSNIVINASTGSESQILPPSNVSATQSMTNFGVYQDYSNTITWEASSDPNVSQYNIFRNGIFFAATDPNTFQFVDHNQIQGGTVTYGVAALLFNARQSPIVSYTLTP